MTRPVDPNSIRQRGFVLLEKLKGVKRAEAITKLKEEFDIGQRYAETIWSYHRIIAKDKGTMPPAYSVHDIRGGKPCMPYMRVEHAFKRPTGTHLTPSGARRAYHEKLERRMAAVKEL